MYSRACVNYWDKAATDFIVFATPNGHVHLAEWSKALQQWVYSEVATAPTCDVLTPGFQWKTLSSTQIVFASDQDKHIHELSRVPYGSGGNADLTGLTAKTGAKALNASLALGNGYAWEGGKAKQVVYWDQGTHHIHELFVVAGSSWTHADLTNIAKQHTPGVPDVPDSKFLANGYAWESYNSKQVVFWDAAGFMHELWVTPTSPWRWANLTTLAKVPAASLVQHVVNGFALEAAQSKQVVYLGRDHHIHELSVTVGGKWGWTDISYETKWSVPQADSHPNPPQIINAYACEPAASRHVLFMYGDEIVEFTHKNGAWSIHEISAQVGPAATGFNALWGYTSPLMNARMILCFDGDGWLRLLESSLTGPDAGTWKMATFQPKDAPGAIKLY